MTTVYLVRHCQSKANAKRIYNSSIEKDEGLTEAGLEQARMVGKFFHGSRLAMVYSSPFLRTRQTAEFIAKAGGADVELVDKFGELDCGRWNGKSEDEIRDEFPDAWKGWRFDPQNNPIPGGESLLEVQARVLPEFERIAKKHSGGSIAIVTHYCVLNVMICSLVSSLANFRCFDTRNGTIAEVSMENVPRIRMYHSPLGK